MAKANTTYIWHNTLKKKKKKKIKCHVASRLLIRGIVVVGVDTDSSISVESL